MNSSNSFNLSLSFRVYYEKEFVAINFRIMKQGPFWIMSCDNFRHSAVIYLAFGFVGFHYFKLLIL